MDNHRAKDRILISVPIKIIQGEDSLFTISGNISATGAYLLSVNPYKNGTILNIEFKIHVSPSKDVIIRCETEILRSEKDDNFNGLHTRFVNLSDEQKQSLNEAMNNLIVHAWYQHEDKSVPYAPSDKEYINHHRDKNRVPFKMWIKDIDFGEHTFVPAQNISAGGMYILVPVEHKKGSHITIEFHVPETDRDVICKAQVVSVKKENDLFGLGLKILDINPVDKKLLENAMDIIISDDWFI